METTQTERVKKKLSREKRRVRGSVEKGLVSAWISTLTTPHQQHSSLSLTLCFSCKFVSRANSSNIHRLSEFSRRDKMLSAKLMTPSSFQTLHLSSRRGTRCLDPRLSWHCISPKMTKCAFLNFSWKVSKLDKRNILYFLNDTKSFATWSKGWRCQQYCQTTFYLF